MSPPGRLDPDREQLLDRLRNLRSILPVFAQEVASARRATARPRKENGRLREQVRQLQHRRAAGNGTREGAPVAATRGAGVPHPWPRERRPLG
jgi:hypothetical protein